MKRDKEGTLLNAKACRLAALPLLFLLPVSASAQVFVSREVQVYATPADTGAALVNGVVSREVQVYASPSDTGAAAALPVSREVNAQAVSTNTPATPENAASREVPFYAGPRETVFVSHDTGDDVNGLGTQQNPLQGLEAAVDYASTYATPERPVRVQAGAGTYDSVLSIPANIHLFGANPFDPSETVIAPSSVKTDLTGGVLVAVSPGVTGATLRDLTLKVGASAKAAGGPLTLLQIDGSELVVDNVVFDGSNAANSLGLEIFDPESSNSILMNSELKDLDVALEATDSGLTMSRCVVSGIHGDAVVVLPSLTRKATTMAPLLGDVNSPADTGYNSFGSVDGFFVNNQTALTVYAQVNSWGLQNPLDIQAKMSGDVVFMPFAGFIVGSEFTATLFVTVINDGNGQPVFNAEVALQPYLGPPILANVNGVYTIASVTPGNYRVTVDAPRFTTAQEVFTVGAPNPLFGLTVHLQPTAEPAPPVPARHSADIDGDGKIGLSEVLRSVQLYNAERIRCLVGTEDGYGLGPGDTASCSNNVADYNPPDWSINLSELLRIIQFYAMGAYHPCPLEEDGYCAS